MYRLIITLAIACLIVYYIVCFAEIFGLMKITKKGSIKPSKLLIPFYYLFKN